jgi:hypothetical protein
VAKNNRSFYRTLFLGLIALGVLIWSAADQFDIPHRELAELFFGILWIVAGTIIAAAVFAGVWIGLRKWWRRSDSDKPQ